MILIIQISKLTLFKLLNIMVTWLLGLNVASVPSYTCLKHQLFTLVTTIRPNVGIMKYKDLRQISVADLPGLIEGAHANKGMGHRFLKHVERTKVILLVVDINGFQLSPQHAFRSCLDTIILLNKVRRQKIFDKDLKIIFQELELYDSTLLDKPSMIVINKMDTQDFAEKYNKIKHQISNLSGKLSCI